MRKPISRFRHGGICRYDTGWYGIGRMRYVFHGNATLPGVTFFLNSYRRAPVHFRLLTCCGMLAERKTARRLRHIFYTGSQVDPRHSWHLRIGRFFVGGTTPKWVLRWQREQEQRRALAAARREGDTGIICPHCNNGVLDYQPGFPGEYIVVCGNRRCGFIAGAAWHERDVI